MERLGHRDYARLLDFIAELQQPIAFAEFGKTLVRLAAGLMPGVTVSFDQIEEQSKFYSLDHDYPMGGAEEASIFARLQELYRQNPIYAYIQSGGGGVVDIATLMPRQQFRRTDFYHDIFRPLGLEHQINVLLNRPGWIQTLTINRDREIPGKTATLLTLASRHIQLAHQNTCLIESLKPVIELEPEGSIPLTSREREVFDWLREGKRNSEIAIILGCSPRTIDKHVENILRKTGAETRTAAVRTKFQD